MYMFITEFWAVNHIAVIFVSGTHSVLYSFSDVGGCWLMSKFKKRHFRAAQTVNINKK